ncbi:MAG TPA: DUF4296 domain-containing protein [Cyclobacteriaceae bacterium]|nr:DUF4296 domain-containing protein [Cyclobacteriaceae bacterium]
MEFFTRFQKYKNVRYFASMFGDQVKISFKRRIRQFITHLGFVFLIVGCEPAKRPPGILSEQEMVKMLTEIYVAEEKAGHIGISQDSVRKIFPQFEARIFEKEGISDSVFKKSLEYYKSKPKKLENIYAALVDSLSLHAQRLAPAAPTPAQ